MTKKVTEIKNNTSDCAQYTGTVTVSSYLGDRLIQQETHHNTGLIKLFRFIGNCLQGNFFEAKYNRPCKIVLLREGTGEDDLENSTPLNLNALDAKERHFWSSEYAVCGPILYDSAAQVETDTRSNPTSAVTYHFRIPFLKLVSGTKIKKLLLLPTITTDYVTDACAYFVLPEPIEVPRASGNFTVIIDWTLTFTNSFSD